MSGKPPPGPPPTAAPSGSAWSTSDQQRYAYPVHPIYAQYAAQHTAAANPGAPQAAWPYAASAWQYSGQPTQNWTQLPSNIRPIQAAQPPVLPRRKTPTPSPSPPPPPPPPLPRNWHGVLRTFLACAGLDQTSRGLDLDLLVLNEDFERERVSAALITLRQGLQRLEKQPDGPTDAEPLDNRKLERYTGRREVEKQTPTSLNKSISQYLARNRARNDASNRAEFLLTPAEKRARFSADANLEEAPTSQASCSRTDARMLDRDVHMQFDIAQNDEGPLKKTVAEHQGRKGKQKEKQPPVAVDVSPDVPTAERHPALDERLRNVETHLAVRYAPALPLSLLDRLKHLEDHIIRLERDNPPWAALHFNQPRRGWPPPPRATPLVVDPRTTVTTASLSATEDDAPDNLRLPKGRGKAKGSSLHRAIAEKLEVQRAMADIKTE